MVVEIDVQVLQRLDALVLFEVLVEVFVLVEIGILVEVVQGVVGGFLALLACFEVVVVNHLLQPSLQTEARSADGSGGYDRSGDETETGA